MTPNNTSSSANSTQNAPATPTASSTSASVSAPSSSTSRPIYPRPSSSSNHPASSKSSLPTTKWHDLPRLQLAPPEHQKQPHAQVKQLLLQQQQEQQQQQQQQNPQRNVLVPNAVHGGSPASVSSSRSASPTPEDPNKAGDKRKSASENPNTKKRRTEQPSQQQYQVRQDYSFATHYSQSYYPPTASASTSSPNYQSPAATASHSPTQASRQTLSTSVSNNYSTFNEFQWRLLHLCSEFYEAATELIRSTPPPVLSQAFQLINNGTGTDPISVLNDARRACDMLITNPQSLAVPPPFPSPISMPTLNSLLHLNARSLSGPSPPIPMTAHSPSLPSTTATATPPYPSTSAPPVTRTSADLGPQGEAPKNTCGAANFTSIAQSGQVQGTWKEHEIVKLKELAEKYRIRKKDGKIPIAVPEEAEEVEDAEEVEEEEEEKSPTARTEGANNAPTDPAVEGTAEDGVTNNAAASLAKKSVKDFDEIDWDQVIAEFGDERSRHQILIKATFLGLKPSSSLPGVKKKKKKKKLPAQPFTRLLTSVALPPPAAAATSNAPHGTAAPSAQVLTLTPAATLTSGASATAYYNSLRNRPGARTSSQYTPAPTAGPHIHIPSRTTSGSKSTAQLPSARSRDKTASSTTDKAQSTTTAPAVPPPTTIAAASTMASPATVGMSNVSAYGVPPPHPWGYPPPSAAMAQPVTGQSAAPYYPYAGMYYSQGYPIQSYSITGGPTIQGVAPVAGGPGGPPPPMFVQTHPHYNPPHARRNAPVGQTFYAYVPRTEDNPGPKKTTKKNGAGAATPTAGPTSSTFVVPRASNISPKTSRSDQTATDRPASATPAATPKSTGAEPQLPP